MKSWVLICAAIDDLINGGVTARSLAPGEAAVWIATRLQLGSEGVRTVGPTREGDMGARVLLLAMLAACAGGEPARDDDRPAGGVATLSGYLPEGPLSPARSG